MDTVTDDRPHVREGRIFKGHRIMAGITQRDLSTETGIPLSMIREYEQGRCMPGPARLILIVNRLSIPMEAFAAVESPTETAC
jgi:transcriptional regulator with XRE-family HTH domain